MYTEKHLKNKIIGINVIVQKFDNFIVNQISFVAYSRKLLFWLRSYGGQLSVFCFLIAPQSFDGIIFYFRK